MYNTILLAAALQRWDRYSAHALAARELALFIAQNSSQRLYVLSAYDYEVPPTTDILANTTITTLRVEHIRRTDILMVQKLDEYVAPLEAAGMEVTKILRVGSPRKVIVQVAREIEADMLIIGSHSKRGILDIALGGTAQSVSRRAPCAVLLASPKT